MNNIPSFWGRRHVLKIQEVSVSEVEEEMSELVTTAWVITVVLLVVSLIVVLVLNTRTQKVKAQNYRRLILFGVLWFLVGGRAHGRLCAHGRPVLDRASGRCARSRVSARRPVASVEILGKIIHFFRSRPGR